MLWNLPLNIPLCLKIRCQRQKWETAERKIYRSVLGLHFAQLLTFFAKTLKNIQKKANYISEKVFIFPNFFV